MVRLVVPQSSSMQLNVNAKPYKPSDRLNRAHIHRVHRAKGWENYRRRKNLPPGQVQQRARSGWDMWRFKWCRYHKSNDWKAAGKAWRSLTPEKRAVWGAFCEVDKIMPRKTVEDLFDLPIFKESFLI